MSILKFKDLRLKDKITIDLKLKTGYNVDMKNYELDKKALQFALNKHDGQVFNDNTGRPYIEHCKSVYVNLFTYVPDSIEKRDILAATALLHDTLEDTNTTYDEILRVFGKEVADNVLALTKNKELPHEEQMSDSLNRIINTSKEAGMVKLADRITNITKLHPLWDYKKSMNYLKEADLILNTLGDVNNNLAEKLKKLILEYEKAINKKFDIL